MGGYCPLINASDKKIGFGDAKKLKCAEVDTDTPYLQCLFLLPFFRRGSVPTISHNANIKFLQFCLRLSYFFRLTFQVFHRRLLFQSPMVLAAVLFVFFKQNFVESLVAGRGVVEVYNPVLSRHVYRLPE